jgi:hypothetical protein
VDVGRVGERHIDFDALEERGDREEDEPVGARLDFSGQVRDAAVRVGLLSCQ